MNIYKFEIKLQDKKIFFDSEVNGLVVNGELYQSGEDGILVYGKVNKLVANEVTCQFSTNTSTLIPGLKVLGIKYNSYFDKRDEIESQNDITFYWQPSRLAAYYNRYSTDGVDADKREPIIRSAVEFLTDSKNMNEDFLPEEKLSKLNEECKLIGFYEGFPIFDAACGFPQLLSNLGIHVGHDSITISTPRDAYQEDVFELAESIQNKTGIAGVKKKNRVRFPVDSIIVHELGLKTPIHL